MELEQQIADISKVMDNLEIWINSHEEHDRDEEAYQKIVAHCEEIKRLSILLYEENKQPYKQAEQQKLC